MSKRKCFCRDCNGRTRSWNTVKRHRALGCEVSQLSVELKIFGLLVELLNGTNSCAKQLSAEYNSGIAAKTLSI